MDLSDATQVLIRVMTETLEQEGICLEGSFLENGGDSLAAIVAVDLLADEGIDLPLEALFDDESLSTLARRIATR